MRIFNCGKDKVWMDPTKLKVIEQAKSRIEVEKLIDQQVIVRRPLKSGERPWWRYERIYNKPPTPTVKKDLQTRPKLQAITSPVTLYNIPLEKLPESMRKQMARRQDHIRQYVEKAFVGANANEQTVQKEYMEKVLESYAARRPNQVQQQTKKNKSKRPSQTTTKSENAAKKSMEDVD
jgi:hypothetical protein